MHMRDEVRKNVNISVTQENREIQKLEEGAVQMESDEKRLLPKLKWNYTSMDYNAIACDRIRANGALFRLVAIASFIEITSDLYTKNLAVFYGDNETLRYWLTEVWEPEELQHGWALRRYIATVWPAFDWETAYNGFRKEYGSMCTIDALEPAQAGEMVARMVVETGTSTFYKALHAYAVDLEEPVLAQIAANISKDEIYHFERFETMFRHYNETRKLSRTEITRIIVGRLREASEEDIATALRYIQPDCAFETLQSWKGYAKKYYPYSMAIKMLMRPLNLNPLVEKAVAASLRSSLKVFGI